MNIFACFFYFDILYSSLHISMGPNKMASKNVQVYDLGWGGLTYSLMTIKCLTWYFFTSNYNKPPLLQLALNCI